jgi:cob(I)alamin adenosyltransferase
MPTFFTETGDDGTTGLLGVGRVEKSDLRMEALGGLDEANAALGLARSQCLPDLVPYILHIQRDLYRMMAEVAATQENAARFHSTGFEQVQWVSDQTGALGAQVDLPSDFILPGDTQAAAALDLARTIVRRAERRIVELYLTGEILNNELLKYLNRLSSLCFVMELYEIQHSQHQGPTLAKKSE